MSYEMIFGGNSTDGKVEAIKRTASCRKLFKKFSILSLENILLSLLLLVVDYTEKFETNSDIHSIS
jgi:hypothetical protein